ncbi:MAG: YvcK family protein [Clostridia bacterium]|nr:YvcK family protein [Clostridia bacterium]
MNNLKDWFGSGLKIKRWLLLVLIGTVVLSYGIANMKLSTQLNVQSVITTMLLFIIGIIAIVTGFIMTQRRIIQAVAEAGNTSNSRNLNIKKLIFDKKTLDKSIKVVVIGQGDGMEALLQGIKHFSNNITSIVSTIDDEADKNAQIAEVRRAIVALAENDKDELESFMNYKSKTGIDMTTMIFDAMMANHSNNFSRAVSGVSDVIAIAGRVLPSTVDKASLGAVLSDGSRIHGKADILLGGSSRKLPIEKVFLIPERCAPAPGVIKSIKEADLIIIGPGSLYTGIIPILLIKEIADEIKKSKAVKVFVSNIMTEAGQTDGYSLSDHINALHEHAGKGIIDYCIASDSDIMPEYIRMYNKKNSDVIEIDKTRIKNTGVRLAVEDMSIVDKNGKIRHDSLKLAKAIISIMIASLDISDNEQALEYYSMKNKLKNMNSNGKKKNVLFRDVKVIPNKKK